MLTTPRPSWLLALGSWPLALSCIIPRYVKNKIIFLDIDHTLIDESLYPSASALEALKQAKANGHRLYLNSGRSVCQVFDYLWEIGFNGFIGGNGSYIESEGKALFYQPIPQALANRIWAYLTENQIGFFAEGQKSLFADPLYLPKLATLLKVSEAEARAKTNRIFPSTSYNQTEPKDNINKFSIVLNDDVDLQVVSDYVNPELVTGKWQLFGQPREFADLFQGGRNKGNAVQFLMKALNLPMSDAFCFGDSSNDIEMLRMAGTAWQWAMPSHNLRLLPITLPINWAGWTLESLSAS